jgi:hypothetical protein
MLGNIVVGLVALIHLYIVYLEMAAWDTPRGHKAFNLTPDFAKASKVLAANQGLYNGFLAAGLIWGLYLGAAGFQVKVFFLFVRGDRRALRRGDRIEKNSLYTDRAGCAWSRPVVGRLVAATANQRQPFG